MSEYRVYMHKKNKNKKTKKNYFKNYFFSVIQSYEYEYEEYPDQDNYGSNKPQDTKITSIGSTEKTSIRSTTHPTIDEISIKENEQTSHATEMSTAESTKRYLR